jgi:hypothetical protein
MYQAVQIVGSLLILAAFMATQLGRLSPTGYRYLIANTVGSALLTVTAVLGREWGFLLLEGVWAATSAYALANTAIRDRRRAATRGRAVT